MALEYLKLAHVTEMMSDAELTKAGVIASIAANELIVVNLKGRILTAAQVEKHLDGTLDGETVEWE
jgi:hypothetical protein